MASQKLVSKVKTRQVVKPADQVVKQEQSLEMVQSLMLVSVCTSLPSSRLRLTLTVHNHLQLEVKHVQYWDLALS